MRTQTYTHRSIIHAPAAEVFHWHLREGALQRLTPPWEKVRLIEQRGEIERDRLVVMKVKIGPIWRTWVAQHKDFQPGVMFKDVQVTGPFAFWEHVHRVQGVNEQQCELVDEVRYALPGGSAGEALGGAMTRGQLQRMFGYRHRTTVADLQRHRLMRVGGSGEPAQAKQRVLVTGASGLVGSALVPFLTTGGHRVIRLLRPGAQASTPTGMQATTTDAPVGALSLQQLTSDAGAMQAEAVVHLAGETIMGRWSAEKKERIRSSRVNMTRALCEALARQQHRPKVLISASAIGIYGDHGESEITENTAMGDGFLAEVARDWEAATEPARAAGIRVVQLRIGVVLTPGGAALGGMLPAFQMGVGGPIGHGRQYWSWIALDDLLYIIHQAMCDESMHGPFNAVAPMPVTNREFTKTLGRVLQRPTLLPAPAWALKLAMGEVADFATMSQRVIPQRLQSAGYRFEYPQLEPALRHMLGRGK